MSSRVLTIRLADGSDSVLVKAEQQKSGIGISLTATDGSYPYAVALEKSTSDKFRAKTFTGSDEEWQEILAHVFLGQTGSLDSTTFDDIELFATVGESLSLVIRKVLDGVTQRIGTINLDRDEELEIELFEWTKQAVSASDQATSRLNDTLKQVDEQRKALDKLKMQLDDLVTAKKEYEEELLSKFAQLLNTKKLKIRDLQRVIGRAASDGKNADEGSEESKGVKRSTQSSRKGKRKASSESDDAFEVAPVARTDQQAAQDSDTTEQEETPSASEDDMEEDKSDVEQPVASQGTSRTRRTTGRAEGSQPASSQTARDSTSKDADSRLPPRRQLPFGKSSAKASTQVEQKRSTRAQSQSQSQQAANAQSETDDEL